MLDNNINTLKLFILLSTFILVSCSQGSWPVDGVDNSKSDLPVVQISDATVGVKKTSETIINPYKNASTYLISDTSGFESPTSYPGYKLVWSDDFNDSSLDTSVWNYRTGTGYEGGWGNNELEYYTSRPENVYLSGGNLVIEARKESYGGRQYTSGRINTRGKFDFTYGRVDIRAKLPVGQGIWPALWMLGYDPNNLHYWPEQGEIDIMELLGNQPNKVYGTLHWQRANGLTANNQGVYKLLSGDFSQNYHVFSLLWTPDSMQFLVDDNVYKTIDITPSSFTDLYNGYYPFDNPFYLIFNVAVGGNWPGSPDSTTQFPQKMLVDYVRVFQKN